MSGRRTNGRRTEGDAGPLTVGVLGLGEAGAAIAEGLVRAGARVTAWDPDPARVLEDVESAPDTAAAVIGSEVVLSLNSASASQAAARAAAAVLRPGQVYADLNSGGRSLKLEVAEIVAPTGALFVDGALMDGVPARGLGTRVLASGQGASRFASLLGPMGMPIEVIGEAPGDAATRKLLRSIFSKGIAAVTIEAVSAAGAARSEDWLREEIGSWIAASDARLIERLVEGTHTHAIRRLHEMEEVRDLLDELAVESRITDATIGYLRELSRGNDQSQASQGGGNEY